MWLVRTLLVVGMLQWASSSSGVGNFFDTCCSVTIGGSTPPDKSKQIVSMRNHQLGQCCDVCHKIAECMAYTWDEDRTCTLFKHGAPSPATSPSTAAKQAVFVGSIDRSCVTTSGTPLPSSDTKPSARPHPPAAMTSPTNDLEDEIPDIWIVLLASGVGMAILLGVIIALYMEKRRVEKRVMGSRRSAAPTAQKLPQMAATSGNADLDNIRTADLFGSARAKDPLKAKDPLNLKDPTSTRTATPLDLTSIQTKDKSLSAAHVPK